MWNGREIRDTETHRKKPCEDRHAGKIDCMKTHKEDGHVEMEAETGMRQLHTGTSRINYQGQSEAGQQQNRVSSLEPSGEHGPAGTLILDFWSTEL